MTPPRTAVIACGALAREILAVIRANHLDHVSLSCLPAELHNRPERIPEAVRARIRAVRTRVDRVLVAYGDCGTGGALDAVLAEEGAERLPGEHCYAFYWGPEAFEAAHAGDPTCFYLTDYLARQFETLVIKGLGIDRHPELLSMYFGNYTKLVYLAQSDDADLTRQAESAAARLGLAFERRETGLGLLPAFLDRAPAEV